MSKREDERPHSAVPHSMDTLLHIFEHLSPKECFNCRAVCRTWCHAVHKHFRTMSRLTIIYQDVTTTADDNRSSKRVSKGETSQNTLEVSRILSYHKFAYILSLFPSVQHFRLTNHPLNDIFLSFLVVFLPRLSELSLQSCWMHPAMLQDRLNRSNSSTNSLCTIMSRIFCLKHLRENEPSLEHLLDIIQQSSSSESLSTQLCAYLQGMRDSSFCPADAQLEAAEMPIDICIQSQLTKTGYELLVRSYTRMTCLTLSNCGLTEDKAEMVIKELRHIRQLNIVDNEQIDGHCLQYLSPTCESLTAGSFNLQVSILNFLTGIIRSGVSGLKNLELTGYISGTMHQLERLSQLERFVLHFYCDGTGPLSAAFEPITRLRHLRSLVLQQEYCYEERSAINPELLAAIVRHCPRLQQLDVLGEYGWKLLLDDQSLIDFASNALNLRHLTLTGNSSLITDEGVGALTILANLETLTLTSFDSITDKSISALVMELKNLNTLCLRDNPQLTIKTLESCVDAAYLNPGRTLNVYIDEKPMCGSKLLIKYASNYLRDTWHQMDPLLHEWHHSEQRTSDESTFEPEKIRQQQQRWPSNLNVVIDENLRSYKYDAEDLTLTKLITIFFASILIILMMVTTLVVVVFLPAIMALYVLYEKILANIFLLRAND